MPIQANVSNLVQVGAEATFFILLMIFTLHALFLGYHWFAFGSSKHISTIALAIYLCGGAILLLTFSLALRAL